MTISGLQIPWTFTIFVLSVVFQAGATIYMLLQHGKDIKQIKIDIRQNKDDVERRLYTRDSMPIYVPGVQCDMHRAECEKGRQREYDHMAEMLRKNSDEVKKLTDTFNILLNRKKRSTNGN